LPEEFKKCRPYLIEELRALRSVSVVVALGKVAFDEYLKACEALEHGRFRPLRPAPRFGHGAVYHLPWNVTLFGSYHPSQQNTFTGKLTRPMFHAVFRQARRLVKRGHTSSNPKVFTSGDVKT
jgi:uracil-DNA glycosylase